MVTTRADPQTAAVERPHALAFDLTVKCERPVEFVLKLRLPWWLAGKPTISVDGVPLDVPAAPSSFYSIRQVWQDQRIHVSLPKRLTAWPLPDRADTVAFMDGPLALAGLVEESRVLYGDVANPETMLAPDNQREWAFWRSGWHTHGQERDFRLLPLADIGSEHYTTYFQVKGRPA
jgi:uncharacterized protein